MFWTLFIALAMLVVSYALMPRPKVAKPEAAKDMESPTAEAGRPVPIIFGTITVSGVNVLWYGQKNKRQTKV